MPIQIQRDQKIFHSVLPSPNGCVLPGPALAGSSSHHPLLAFKAAQGCLLQPAAAFVFTAQWRLVAEAVADLCVLILLGAVSATVKVLQLYSEIGGRPGVGSAAGSGISGVLALGLP